MKYKIKLNRFSAILILIIEILLLSIIMPSFFTFSSFMGVVKQVSITGIVAVGVTFVFIAGGMDLLVGSQMALSAMLSAGLMVYLNVSPWIASLLCIFLCILMGMINGYIASKLYIHPFIITTAISFIYRGMAKTINSGMPIYGMPDRFISFVQIEILGIPLTVIIFILSIITGEFILYKTYIGKYFYALGEDEKIAELAGLNTRMIKVFVYSLCVFFTGIASIIILSRIGSAQPDVATGIELDVLAAAALGGISFKGGRGKIINIIIAVFVIEIFGIMLVVFNVGEYYRNIIKGTVLLIAIALDKSAHRVK